MNIGLIGSVDENMHCVKNVDSKISKKIICFPGGGGTARIAKH